MVTEIKQEKENEMRTVRVSKITRHAAKVRKGLALNGHEIKPGANLAGVKLSGANLTDAILPEGLTSEL